MRELSTELKVGAFALLVLAVLTFMTFKVGGLDWAKKKGYAVHVIFSSTAGLDEKTRVRIAGVDSGVVESIGLIDGRARVTLRIDPRVKIYKNAQSSIRSAGLLGDKYLDIHIGSPEAGQLKDGDTITDVIEVADMDDLARNLITFSQSFTRLSESLNEVLGDEKTKKSLNETIVNFKEISSTLHQAITLNDQKLRTILDHISTLTASLNGLVDSNREPLSTSITNMKDFSVSLKSSGPELIENLNRATKDLKDMIEENRSGIRNTVDSFDKITQQVQKGEGTLGKLVNDDRLYDSLNKSADGMNKTLAAVDRFRAYMTFQAEYLAREKDGRASFDVTLQPDKDKYYILGAVGGGLRSSSVKDITNSPPGKTVTHEELSDKIRFNAQFGKRFDNAAVRLGLFENTFGVGGDYFFSNDKGKITVDVWDVQKIEENAKTVHLKAGVSYFLFKNLFLNAGGDNLLSNRYRGAYVGMGVRFEGEDFK
jgi:phospholipid/cholesterol/gamma-HCH transport system substrate-binding protein